MAIWILSLSSSVSIISYFLVALDMSVSKILETLSLRFSFRQVLSAPI